MKEDKVDKLALREFQQYAKKVRALKPFEAYERQFVQDRIKAHAGNIGVRDIYLWIEGNLDMGRGGDATSHGGDILVAAYHLSHDSAKKFLRARGGKRRSTVAYFEKGGY